MQSRNLIRNAKINPEKLARAKELRLEMTPGEKILWKNLRGNQLGGYHFRRQQIIAGFIADFYCDSAGLVVEVDGGIHQRQHEYDAERDKIFNDLGLTVLRIREEDVIEKPDEVLSAILIMVNHGNA